VLSATITCTYGTLTFPAAANNANIRLLYGSSAVKTSNMTIIGSLEHVNDVFYSFLS
jgi:hypothetical protein